MSESVGSADSLNHSEEEDEGLDDRCNSAGEEIEDEEFDESHLEEQEGHTLTESTFHGTSTEGDGECFCALYVQRNLSIKRTSNDW